MWEEPRMNFVRIGEFIGSAVDIAVEVQKDLGKV